MQDQLEMDLKDSPQVEAPEALIDHKDLAVLWAVGVLVSLLISLAGTMWHPANYDAIQSTAVDETEARVENSQNQLVADALNNGEIEYHFSMDKLVKLKPAYVRFSVDLIRLILFPCGPIVIIGLLIRKSIQHSKQHS